MDVTAKIAVFGKVSAIMEVTFFPPLWYDSRK